MSIRLMSLVWQDHTGTLTGIEKAVLLRMADFAADNGTQIFPTIKRIAADIGFSETAVKDAIKNLVKKKYISKTIRTSKAVHISNLYRINTTTLNNATVDKPVKKSGISKGGGSPDDPGVGRQTTQGGSPDDCDPPPNHHLDPSPAKDDNNCSKNEQQEPEPERPSKISTAEKKKIMQDMAQLLRQTKTKPRSTRR